MGDKQHDQIARRTSILSGSGIEMRNRIAPDRAIGDIPLVLPLLGSAEAGASYDLATLVAGTPLVLEDSGSRIDVLHGTRLLGYLGGHWAAVQEHIRQRGVPACTLHSRGGSDGESPASVAIWL